MKPSTRSLALVALLSQSCLGVYGSDFSSSGQNVGSRVTLRGDAGPMSFTWVVPRGDPNPVWRSDNHNAAGKSGVNRRGNDNAGRNNVPGFGPTVEYNNPERESRQGHRQSEQQEREQVREDERFPRVGESYWVPYGDRTVAAMSFPVVAHEFFTPVVIEEVLLPVGKAKSLYQKPKKVVKPKSDFGVVVSRNSVLKRNFRDYAKLNVYEGDSRGPDELILDVAKIFTRSSGFRKNRKTFVIVAFESHMKTPTRGQLTGAIGDSGVFHNGTLIFPSKEKPGHLTTIPFTLRTIQEVEDIIGESNMKLEHENETVQTKSFLKLVAGMHKDTFEDGRDAMERFLKRSMSLKRPYFDVSVENTTVDQRDDTQDRIDREERLRLESLFRNEAWFFTNTIGIRSISPPQFVENLLPVQPIRPHLYLPPLQKHVDVFERPISQSYQSPWSHLAKKVDSVEPIHQHSHLPNSEKPEVPAQHPIDHSYKSPWNSFAEKLATYGIV